MWPSSLHPVKKASSSLQFRQEENISGHSLERRPYQCVLKIARVFPTPIFRVEIG